MKIRRASHVAWRAVGDETVVLNLASKRIFGLSAAGAELWTTLAQERTFAHLVGDARVLSRQLDELHAAGLVELDGELPLAVPATDGEPVLVWQEKLERAVGQCALIYGQSELCSLSPGGS